MQFTGYLYLMDFGVRESIVRYTSRFNAKGYKTILNQILSTALVLYSFIALVSLLFVAVSAWFFPTLFGISPELENEVRLVVLISGLTVSQAFIFNVFSGILMGLHRAYLANFFNILISLIRAGLIVYFLGAGYGIVALSAIQLFIGFCTGIVLLFLALRMLNQADLKFNFILRGRKRFSAIARRLFNYSIFVFVNNIASKVIFATDAIVIGIFLPVSQVTFYAIPGSLIGYLRQLMTASSYVFNPVTSHYAALGKQHQVRSVLSSGSRFNLFVGFPVAITYILLGTEFIGLWMGEEYADQSGAVIVVLGIAQLLTLHEYTLLGVLYGLSKHKVLAYWRIGEAVINLLLSIVLIQYYGLIGVAYGTAIPHIFIALVFLPLYARKACGISLSEYWLASFVRPVLGILPYVFAVWWVKENVEIASLGKFFIYIAMFSIAYVLIAFFIVLLPNERKKFISMINERLNKRSIIADKD